MKKGIMIGIGITAILLLIVFWYVGTYNSLVKLNEDVNNKWAQVETQYQRRVDLIPNLVNTVKGAANFEQKTLTDITNARSQWGSAKTQEQKVEAANNIESALARLLVVVENYPQLKATQNFLALQDELAGTENRIAIERMRYNEAIQRYNVIVRRFPSNIAANLFGFQKKDAYFEAAPEAKAVPKVEF